MASTTRAPGVQREYQTAPLIRLGGGLAGATRAVTYDIVNRGSSRSSVLSESAGWLTTPIRLVGIRVGLNDARAGGQREYQTSLLNRAAPLPLYMAHTVLVWILEPRRQRRATS